MKKQTSLYLSDRAVDKLTSLSRELGLSRDDFASLCLEYVDVSHQGIVTAAEKIRVKKERASKKNLSQHISQLSAEQIELLISKAAEKNKN